MDRFRNRFPIIKVLECEAILSVVHVKLLRGFQLNLIVEILRSHVTLNYYHRVGIEIGYRQYC